MCDQTGSPPKAVLLLCYRPGVGKPSEWQGSTMASKHESGAGAAVDGWSVLERHVTRGKNVMG